MKKKIKVVDKTTGKTTEGEIVIRDKAHFEAQLKNKAHVFKPKKGKGSFKRNKKTDEI